MCTALPETCIPGLGSFGPSGTQLRSGKGNPDADTDATDATADDESNPYMSPSQATQKCT